MAPHKICSGLPLEVLGVVVEADESGAAFWPSEDKVKKWIAEIQAARAPLPAIMGGACADEGLASLPESGL